MKKFAVILCAILVLTFAEYRFIMTSLKLYYAPDGYIYIDFMGNTDSYYAEPIFMEE